MAWVLDVRRGDGTYVTSLAPAELLEGLGLAVELMQGNTLLELTEARRLFEPVATGLAAARMTPDQLAEIKGHLDAMHTAAEDVELLNNTTPRSTARSSRPGSWRRPGSRPR